MNKSNNNHCKQVSASEASIKCPQFLTQSMASNTETSALGSTDSISETVTTTTTISHQLPNLTTTSSAQRVRTKSARPARKSPQASTTHKSKMTATIAGSASEHTVGCVPTEALPSAPTASTTLSAVCADPNEHCKVIDTAKHKSAQGNELPSCSCVVEYARIIDVGLPPHSAPSTSDKHATATAPVGDVKRRTTKETTDTKIATTTSKHTASSALALTVTRQTRTRTPAIVPATSSSAASATCALRQLTKEKTSIPSTTTTATTTVATTTKTNTSTALATKTKVAASPTVIAGEAAYSFATTATRRPVHSASARLTSTSSARISSTASQVEGVALTATVDAKSKFTENKCPLAVLTNVSNQRKVEANSTIPATEQQCKLVNNNSNTNNSIYQSSESNNKYSKRNSNRVPSNKWPPTEVSSVSTEYDPAYQTSAHADTTNTNSHSKDTVSTVNLAARKAKLKSDFFKIFQVHEPVSPRSKQTTSLTDICGAVKTQRISCKDFCEAESAKVDKSSSSGNQQPAYAAVKGLPRIDVQPVEFGSLVSQRRLALTQKFAQHSAPKSSYRSHKQQLIGAVKVEDLVQRFERQTTKAKRKRMIVQPQKTCEHTDIDMLNLKPDTLEQRNSPISDEGCNLGQSPYSSDSEDTTEMAKGTARNAVEHIKRKGKVVRTASSDSAVDLDVDECMDTAPAQPPVGAAAAGNQQRRMTLTVTDLPLRPALLPLAEPTALPDTTLIELPPKALYNPPPEPVAVPSKVLLEERVVELPEDPRTLAPSLPCSRRESAQSCASDTIPTEFPVGKRFVRTPSVVVSDYSDEILCGITLEEIEYLRAQRMRRRHSSLDTANEGEGECDVSASSSCSNLYYCGSTISALDGAECYVNGIRTALERKASDCSTCSVSADEETFTIHEDPQAESKDISELLAAQHLDAKPIAKKVGLVVPIGESLSEKINY